MIFIYDFDLHFLIISASLVFICLLDILHLLLKKKCLLRPLPIYSLTFSAFDVDLYEFIVYFYIKFIRHSLLLVSSPGVIQGNSKVGTKSVS